MRNGRAKLSKLRNRNCETAIITLKKQYADCYTGISHKCNYVNLTTETKQ